MENIKSVCCKLCGQVCVVRDSEHIYYHEEGLICQSCLNSSAPGQNHIALDLMERNALKEKIIMAMCHPDQGAYFAVKPNFYLVCYNCREAIVQMQFFNLSSPQVALTSAFNQVCKQDFEKSIINRWKQRLQHNQRIVDIHKNLIESYFFLSTVPICTNHLYEALYYDIVSFEFKCNNCVLGETVCMLSDQAHFSYIISVCKETLKSIPTPAFNSLMIEAWKQNNFNKDFLFFMKNALEELKNKTITLKTLCLLCGQPFGFALRHPIQLHAEILHEICLECFGNFNPTACFIDGCGIVDKITPVNINLLTKTLKKCHEHSDFSFCIRKNDIPYSFCCIPNFCNNCLPDSSIDEEIECNKCKVRSGRDKFVQNFHLIKQIEFIELICELHNEPGIYYHKKEDSFYCKKCPEAKNILKRQTSFTEDPVQFKIFLLSIIEQQLNSPSPLIIPGLIKKYGLYFSLQTVFNICQYLKSINEKKDDDYQTNKESFNDKILRFVKIMPFNLNITQKWPVKSLYLETLKLKSNGCLELIGLIIGCLDGEGELEVQVYCNEKTVSLHKVEKKSQDNYGFTVFFPQPVLIFRDWVEIGVIFRGSGKYVCHGMPNSRINPLMHKGLEIFFDSDSFENGNNIIGGPILGFQFSKIILSEEEAKIHQLFQTHQF